MKAHTAGAILTLLAMPASAAAQAPASPLPFAVGERLEYVARASLLGRIGEGSLEVQGLESRHGRETYRLAFDLHGKVAFFTISDRTRSWLDPEDMASVGYEKREDTPLGDRVEDVRIFPEQRRWESHGGEGETPTSAPLDELSVLYFVRTLPLRNGDAYTLARHFDQRRNPIELRVVGRGRIEVPAGSFATVAVEMRVRDPGRYDGAGVIRMHLTDDERRIPVRIESTLPGTGKVILDLRAFAGALAGGDRALARGQ